MHIASDDGKMVCTDVCRQSHWSQRAMRRESADTPRLAVDTSATVVAREFGWQNRMKRQESIRTCKVMRMKTWSRRCERARGREAKEEGEIKECQFVWRF